LNYLKLIWKNLNTHLRYQKLTKNLDQGIGPMNLKYFENIDLSNVVIVRMKSMEDIRTKILGVMTENKFKRAVILSAIGSVYDAIFYGVKQKSELPYNQDQITIMKKKNTNMLMITTTVSMRKRYFLKKG